jgi:hypothetical protein
MRSLLALLIGLALVMSPVTSAMAAPACGMNGSAAMAGMGAPDMPGMTIAAVNRAAIDPCCDHAGKSGKSCAKACAAICCVGLVLPSMAASPQLFVQRTAATTVPVIARRSYDPPGLDPPPKSIA